MIKLCDYGCGQEAKHQFKNGKWCCSKNYQLCPIKKRIPLNKCKKITNQYKYKGKTLEQIHGKEKSIKIKEKQSLNMKGKTPWNKGIKIGKQSKELIKKRLRNSKNKRSMINYYKNKHPLLFKIENIKEDRNKNLLAKCKTCNKFFILKKYQLIERIRAIYGLAGYANNYLYC